MKKFYHDLEFFDSHPTFTPTNKSRDKTKASTIAGAFDLKFNRAKQPFITIDMRHGAYRHNEETILLT